MVVICLDPTEPTGTWHERVATPLICTVQAPHWAMPQPYFVPVRPIVSRSTQSSGVRASTSVWYALPLMLRDAIPDLSLLRLQGGWKSAWAAERHASVS